MAQSPKRNTRGTGNARGGTRPSAKGTARRRAGAAAKRAGALSLRKLWAAGGQKRMALVLVGVLLFVALGAALLGVPGLSGTLFRVLGITPHVEVPTVASTVPVGVHFIDVGQGDAVLLEDNGEFALIDAGPPEGRDVLLAYLDAAGVTTLRYVFITHPHADHIGGVEAVLKRIAVQNVVLPDVAKAPNVTSPLFYDVLETIGEKGIAVETAVAGAEYPLGAGSILVVHDGVPTADNANLLSLGLLYQSGALRFLDTGDGEGANERDMLSAPYDLQANVFKAAHHGSHTSNAASFIETVNPQIVVVNCGAGNSYGHPHREALAAFEAVGAEVLRTDRDGMVLVRPDGAGGLVVGTTALDEAAAEAA